MSRGPVAIVANALGLDVNALVEQRLQEDLSQSDREALKAAARLMSAHTSTGAGIGIGLGLLLAFRLRRARQALLSAFRAHEQPVGIKFANGQQAILPNLVPLMRASRLSTVATYTLLGLGGLSAGHLTGTVTGALQAIQQFGREGGRHERIAEAFKRSRADDQRDLAKVREEEKEQSSDRTVGSHNGEPS